MTGTVAGIAAKATAWLAAWGPIAWVGAGLLGAGFFILLGIGFAYARGKLVRASIEKQFYSRADAINPLEEDFRNRRIHLTDMISPIEPVIRGKRFHNCEIIGPVNVILKANYQGSTTITHCHLSSVCAISVRDDAIIVNTVLLEDCRFEHCKLHKITFIFRESAYQWASEMMAGMDWLTPPPPPAPSPLAYASPAFP